MARWFRFYNETLDDPKVQKLSPALFKAWVNLLCLTARHDGTLPPATDIAFALRLSDATVVTTLDELVGAGLLDHDETGLRPHNWRSRQYASDVSTERVKQHRNGKRNVSPSVAVTPSETETDSETEKDPPSPPQAGGSDASQGSGGEPDRRSPRARGDNPRAVGKAAEAKAMAQETQAIRDKRRALWSDRLLQYRASGKWQTTWGAEPWSGNLGCLVPLDMRDEFENARLAVEHPGFMKATARPDAEATAIASRYEELTQRRTG